MGFACLDGFERRSRQNSTDRSSTTIGFWYAGRHANKFVPAIDEEGGRHALAIFFSDGVDDVEVVVDLRRAKVEGRRVLSTHGFVALELRSTQFCGHGIQCFHRFGNSGVGLRVRRGWEHDCDQEPGSQKSTQRKLRLHVMTSLCETSARLRGHTCGKARVRAKSSYHRKINLYTI